MTKKNFIALADFLKARTITPNNGGTFTLACYIKSMTISPQGFKRSGQTMNNQTASKRITKRISKVTVKRMVDTDPDTSYLGE